MTTPDERDDELEAPRPPGLPEGFRMDGWELGPVIGSGGWGTVYEARKVDDGTPAAVKVLPTGALGPGQRAALGELVAREVRFSAEADHPHLVCTHAVCTVEAPQLPALDGAIALVMDRAEASLKDVLDAAETGGPIADADRVLRGVAAGLAHMHDAGWVHGDLKPANVLLGPGGQVWLADFGLTAELDGTHAHLPPLGTLDHLPPRVVVAAHRHPGRRRPAHRRHLGLRRPRPPGAHRRTPPLSRRDGPGPLAGRPDLRPRHGAPAPRRGLR
ncbi:protein kinase family protein [Streptomyces sp. NPDC096046]|uniref:protein kinase family protein n=1 Tax=Streptomyces sp. NPDC096046 TaxID=3155542 RepID=UPI0033258D49